MTNDYLREIETALAEEASGAPLAPDGSSKFDQMVRRAVPKSAHRNRLEEFAKSQAFYELFSSNADYAVSLLAAVRQLGLSSLIDRRSVIRELKNDNLPLGVRTYLYFLLREIDAVPSFSQLALDEKLKSEDPMNWLLLSAINLTPTKTSELLRDLVSTRKVKASNLLPALPSVRRALGSEFVAAMSSLLPLLSVNESRLVAENVDRVYEAGMVKHLNARTAKIIKSAVRPAAILAKIKADKTKRHDAADLVLS